MPSSSDDSTSRIRVVSNDGPRNSLQYVVRCGSMRTLGVMSANDVFRYGDEVVVRTDRGTEWGTVLCEATRAALGAMEEEPTHGRIMRRPTATDRKTREELQSRTTADLAVCQHWVDELKIPLELVDVERLLGDERLVIYFLAEKRVDFRELVRDLAREFHTRIEMRHIGVRDEAKLLADYGDCGQPICCATFLSKMPPVSMRMAKLQKATLDPTKISGRCGRLKCCLRYEFDTYERLAAELPNIGSQILTRDGHATVLAQDILVGQLLVRTEDNRRILLSANDVVSVIQQGIAEEFVQDSEGVDDPKATQRTKRRNPNSS